jgi:hypothetical protein
VLLFTNYVNLGNLLLGDSSLWLVFVSLPFNQRYCLPLFQTWF